MNAQSKPLEGEWRPFRLALPLPLDQCFDYLAPPSTPCGAIVSVTFGKQRLEAVVLGEAEEGAQNFQLRPIIADRGPPWVLPTELLRLGQRVAEYYQAPLGMALGHMLPPPFRKRALVPPLVTDWRLTPGGASALLALPRLGSVQGRLLAALQSGLLSTDSEIACQAAARKHLRTWSAAGWIEAEPALAPAQTSLQLTDSQNCALVELLLAPPDHPALLHGVTGSGKTEIYLAIANTLAGHGQQTLLLVPEINLTPQLELRLRTRAAGLRIGVMHSGLAAGERARVWAMAARGELDLLLGTRLAVFAALPRLGAIILDEEQDASYKQGEGVRYHAREVAIFRAAMQGARVILGSATPSLESYARAQAGRYAWVRLWQRAVPGASLPKVRFLPGLPPGALPLGDALLEAMKQRIAQGEQSLLFINRRGYAPLLRCPSCGWEMSCPHCAAPVVLHLAVAQVCCHHCGHQRPIPRVCAACGNLDLTPRGYGTQRLEEQLRVLLPRARILRIDRDSTRRRHAWLEMLTNIHSGAVDVLIGTQMLVKGHDFPNVTLVGVLGADNAFFSADFRATERLFAQLLQVAGRAGRSEKAGEVLIQTSFPQHPLLAALGSHDYDAGAELLLKERRVATLPPFSHLAMLRAEAPRRASVDEFLSRAHELALAEKTPMEPEVTVFAPVPCPLSRRAGLERGQLLVQAPTRRAMVAYLSVWRTALQKVETRVRWFLDVDPLDFG